MSSGTTTIAILGLTIVAFALRFWRLGAWSFDSDETFTLRDSLHPLLSNPRPLLYFLNHYLVQSFVPLDELGLRLLPAFFGGLATPVFFLVARRAIGRRAALLGAALLTASPLLVYYAQFARYWSLVFLLTAVYPYAFYLGVRDRDRGALLLAAVVGLIATLAHPTSVLLVGGIGIWFVLTYARWGNVRLLWRQPAVRWGSIIAVVLAAVIASRFVPMLQMWIDNHDAGEKSTEFLLHLPGKPGVKQLVYLLGYAESLTLPLVITGLLGVLLLWQRGARSGERSFACFLVCVLGFPVVFLCLLSFRTPVSTFYLVPTTPVFFYAAGVFLDRLALFDWELRPRWLLSGTLLALIVIAGAPTLLSQYRDGRRYDYRDASAWLANQLTRGDLIVSDQPKVVDYYIPGVEAEYLRGIEPLEESMRALEASGRGGSLWIVTPAPAHAFRTNPQLGDLRGWMYTHCQLRNTIGVGRMDFRQYHLQIFRCAARSS